MPVLVKGMEFNIEEIIAWEENLFKGNLIKVYGKSSGNARQKRDGSKRYVSNNRSDYWWVKECAKARKMYQRSFRRKMKKNIFHEGYYHVRARDDKTYGYLTW